MAGNKGWVERWPGRDGLVSEVVGAERAASQ